MMEKSMVRKAKDLTPKDPDFVTSIQRGVKVLSVFDRENPELTLKEVADRCGLSPATARRFLLSKYLPSLQSLLFRLHAPDLNRVVSVLLRDLLIRLCHPGLIIIHGRSRVILLRSAEGTDDAGGRRHTHCRYADRVSHFVQS